MASASDILKKYNINTSSKGNQQSGGNAGSADAILKKYNIAPSSGATLNMDAARQNAQQRQQAWSDYSSGIRESYGSWQNYMDFGKTYTPAREAAVGRGQSMEEWYQQAKSERDSAQKALEALSNKKIEYSGWATDDLTAARVGQIDTSAAMRAAEERLRKAQEQFEYADYWRWSDYFDRQGFAGTAAEGREAAEADRLSEREQADKRLEYSGWTTDDLTTANFDMQGQGLAGTSALAEVTGNRVVADRYDMPGELWTDDEKDLYGYLYATNPELAKEYAWETNTRYANNAKRAKAEEVGKDVNFGEWLGARGAGVLSGVDYLDVGLEYLATGEVRPRSNLGLGGYRDAVDSAIAERLNAKGTIGEGVPIVGGKGLGDLYQIGMSMVNSAATMATGNVLAPILFFGQGAASGYREAMNRGASSGQALATGLAQGAAELIFEKFSMESLITMARGSGLKDIVGNILKQGGVEASEELATSIANTMSDALISAVSGNDSALQGRILQLVADEGMSYEEAQKKAMGETVGDWAYDALSGFISGASMGAGGSAVGEIYGNFTDYSGNSQWLIDRAKAYGKDSPAYAKAEEYAGRMNDKGALSLAQARRIDRAITKTEREADTKTLTEAAEKRLSELGVENAAETAAAIEKNLRGRSLSSKDYNLLQGKAAQQVLQEMSRKNTAEWAKNIGTYQFRSDVYGKREKPKVIATVSNRQAKVKSGEVEGTLNGLNGDGTFNVKTAEGELKTLPIDSPELPENARKLAELLQPLGDGAKVAWAFYTPDIDIYEYADAWTAAQNLYGANNVRLESMLKREAGGVLDEKTLQAAYDEGQKIYQQRKAQREAAAAKSDSGEKQEIVRRSGKVSLKGGEVNGVKLPAVSKGKGNRTDIRAVKAIAKAVGIDVVLFESSADKSGRYEGFNGLYKDGTIYLDINAGRNYEGVGQRALLRTMSHELTHFIQQYAPEQYEELKEFILNRLSEAEGSSIAELVAQKKARAEDVISDEEALDEVIADACEMMLKDSAAITELAKENKTLAENIADWIKGFIEMIKEAFSGIEARHEEAKAMLQFADELQKIWDRGLAVASLELKEKGAKNTASEGGKVQYEIRYPQYTEEDIQRNSVKLQKMTPVATITGEEMDSADGPLDERILKLFEQWGNNIFSEEFGDVALTKSSMRSERRHGNTDPKIRAYPALPFVIQKGVVIDAFQKNENGLERIVVAAPIIVGKQKYFMGVMLQRDANNQRLYAHDVVIEKEPTNISEDILSTTGSPKRGGLYISDILLRALNVKPQYQRRDLNETESTTGQFSLRDDSMTDRELLAEAAGREGASEALKGYGKAFKRYESQQRKLERQQETVAKLEEAAKAAEGEAQATAEKELQEARERLAKTEEGLKKALDRLKALEAGGDIKREIAIARAEWGRQHTEQIAREQRRQREVNAEMQEYINYLRGQLKESRGETATADPNDVRRLAKALLKEYNSDLDAEYLAKRLQRMADYIVSNNKGEGMSYNELHSEARKLAKLIAENSFVENSDNEGLRKDIRAMVKSTRLKISDELRGDIADFESYRKSNMGTFRLAKDGRSIDSLYAELGVSFGEGLFPADITAHSDQLDRILEVLSGLRTQYHPAYTKSELQEVSALLSEEIMDALLSGDVKQVETIADRIAKRYEARISTAFERAENAKGQLRDEQRHRRELVQQRVNEIRAGIYEKREIRQKKINITKAVERLKRKLEKNSKTDRIPEALKAPVAEFLLNVNVLSPRAGEATRKRYTQSMERLERVMAQQSALNEDGESESYYVDWPPELREEMQAHLDELDSITASGGEWVLSQMSLAQLEQLENIVNIVSAAVTKANELTENAAFRHVDEASAASVKSLEEIKSLEAEPEWRRRLRRFFTWSNTIPYYAFKRFGPGGEAIFKEIQQGWSKLAMNSKKILEFALDTYKAEEVQKWEKETHTFKLSKRLITEGTERVEPDFEAIAREAAEDSGEGGNYNPRDEEGEIVSKEKLDVKLSVAQIMSLRALWKRQQAQPHLLGAGIRISDITDAKGKVLSQTDNWLLTLEDIAKITSVLTERQIKVADALQEFMSTVGSQWGNEISMKRWGIRNFAEKNYFPIKTDDKSRNVKTPEGDKASLNRLINMGFTKTPVPNARNAVIIESIFDVFSNHMADMAKYNALAIPIVDAMKWFNYNVKTGESESGQYTTTNLRREMERVYGKEAQKYFVSFMQDLNGVREAGRGEGDLKKFLSNYKVAAIGANLRVVLQQPTSILRARMLIDDKYLAKGVTMKGGIKEALEHSGIANWKDEGYFDVNINRGLREKIKHSDTPIQKLREKSMILAEKGDKLTWGSIWNACKAEIMEKQGLSGEELMKATAERFDEIILSTQVMDSTISRSHNMRSGSMYMSEVTSFMSEPTVSYNMLLDAYMDYALDVRREGGTKAAVSKAWKKHKGKVLRAVSTYAMTGALTAAFAAIADAARDDDEYQNAVEKWTEHFWANFKDNLNPINLVPMVNTFYGILIQGDTKSSMLWEPIQRARKALDIFLEMYRLNTGKIEEATQVTYYGNMTWYGRMYNYLSAASGLFGIPLASGMREVQMLWNNTVGAFSSSLKLRTYDPGRSKEIQTALEQGYMSEEEALQELLNHGIAKSREDAEQTLYKWSLDGAGVYTAVKAAALARDKTAFDAAVKELEAAHYSRADIESVMRGQIKEWYQGTEDEGRKVNSKKLAIEMLQTYGGMDLETATKTATKWTMKVTEGIAYDDMQEAFVEGRISEDKTLTLLQTYGGYEADEAADKVLNWRCEKETGIPYSEIQKAYAAGEINEEKVISMLQTYGGKTEEEAEDTALRYAFIGNDSSLKGISAAAAADYYLLAEPTGMSTKSYYEYWKAMNQFEGEKDENGKTKIYSKQRQIIAYIHSLPISDEQKDALWRVHNWAESGLAETPWHLD